MEDVEKPRKIVFVTVGTTCFDALVKAMDTEVVKEELVRRGYTHLLIQMGRGSYVPAKVYLHSVVSLYLYMRSLTLWSCDSLILFLRVFCIFVSPESSRG